MHTTPPSPPALLLCHTKSTISQMPKPFDVIDYLLFSTLTAIALSTPPQPVIIPDLLSKLTLPCMHVYDEDEDKSRERSVDVGRGRDK
ncbi:hypothetical protein BC567DRAFT_234307 [Phyllosticta citribraziliensis]